MKNSKSNEIISDLMKPEEANNYKMLVARPGYLANGKFDVQYAVKEASKNMAQPQLHHLSLPKGIGKYLVDAPRVVQKFQWQRMMNVASGHMAETWQGTKRPRNRRVGEYAELVPMS